MSKIVAVHSGSDQWPLLTDIVIVLVWRHQAPEECTCLQIIKHKLRVTDLIIWSVPSKFWFLKIILIKVKNIFYQKMQKIKVKINLKLNELTGSSWSQMCHCFPLNLLCSAPPELHCFNHLDIKGSEEITVMAANRSWFLQQTQILIWLSQTKILRRK